MADSFEQTFGGGRRGSTVRVDPEITPDNYPDRCRDHHLASASELHDLATNLEISADNHTELIAELKSWTEQHPEWDWALNWGPDGVSDDHLCTLRRKDAPAGIEWGIRTHNGEFFCFLIGGRLRGEETIDGNEKLLYTLMRQMDQKAGAAFVWPTKHWATMLNVPSEYVLDTLKELESKGLVERERPGGRLWSVKY